jgi:hypothetical protein
MTETETRRIFKRLYIQKYIIFGFRLFKIEADVTLNMS